MLKYLRHIQKWGLSKPPGSSYIPFGWTAQCPPYFVVIVSIHNNVTSQKVRGSMQSAVVRAGIQVQ